ncbi:MAG: BCCT family transporter [Sarcina sp.]
MVFYISIIFIGIFVLWGLISSNTLSYLATSALHFTTSKFGWLFLIITFTILIFIIWLAISKYGQLKLGKDDDKPKFNNITWFSMLFSAGMGIGIIFWGVAEPLDHYVFPPLGKILSVICIILIMTFFVSSADSATYVLGIFSSKGNVNPKVSTKIILGVLESLIAVSLLMSGGLKGLQTMSILTALPFSIILILIFASLIKALKKETPLLKTKKNLSQLRKSEKNRCDF